MSPKKFFFRFLSLPILLFFLYSVHYYRENIRFVNFTKDIFCHELCENTLNLHYTLASPQKFGITDYPLTLGNASPEALSSGSRQLRQYQQKLSRFSPVFLSGSNRLTYDILDTCFQRHERMSPFLLYEEPLGPTVGTQAQLPILLAEYAFRNLSDIQDYFSLLKQLDTYYASILQYEQAKSQAGLFMSDSSADHIIAQCQSFIQAPQNFLLPVFEEKLQAFPDLTAPQKQKLIQTHEQLIQEHVIPAYQLLIQGLTKLKGTGTHEGGLCQLPNGREYYTCLVQETTGCSLSVSQIEQRIVKQLRSDFLELTALVKLHPQFLKQCTKTNTEQDPAQILTKLKARLSTDFPEPPETLCQIKYVHPSLEPYLSPAFYLTPPLDSASTNVIYLNRSAHYSSLDLFTTLAHEGYPGHLYQAIYSDHVPSNPVRSLFNFGGYVEGWATYVELYSYSLSDVDPVTASFYRLDRSIALGLSALMDIAIHDHGYSRSQTATYLSTIGFRDPSLANQLYDTILEAPANYLKYYVGYLCFLDLRTEAQKKQGDAFCLKDFHKDILTIGPAPFDILKKYSNYSVTLRTKRINPPVHQLFMYRGILLFQI